jgi:hypothetical protein
MKDDIIKMAHEAGIDHWWESGNEHREVLQQHLKRFAALVSAAEREACAKLIESHKTGANELMDAVREMESRAIRARGQA